ncbi:MetK_2 protein [Elysia marginata]|uniref:MetK_2 protein n=1 Tax=Elysia marginata TaxID=1093978 RepID=A0AAV4HKZ1_9GAST|nr:MetK_2 protein [Elysia marginata]
MAQVNESGRSQSASQHQKAMAERATTLIVWQDASVRWKDGFEVIFKRAALYGQQIVVTDHADRVTSNTMPEMFQYMREDVCRYHDVPEIANAMALHRPDPLVVRAIMNPWARCALEASCMCPSNYNVWVIRHCVKLGGNHRCHRFDQSALTLLTAKLYGEKRYKVEIPEQHKHVRVMRGDRLKTYFQD